MYNILGKKHRDGDIITIATQGDYNKAIKKAEKLVSKGWRDIIVIDSQTKEIEYEIY